MKQEFKTMQNKFYFEKSLFDFPWHSIRNSKLSQNSSIYIEQLTTYIVELCKTLFLYKKIYFSTFPFKVISTGKSQVYGNVMLLHLSLE